MTGPIEVPLTKGYVARVDACDAWVLAHNWHAVVVHERAIYGRRWVRRPEGGRIVEYLHRAVLGEARGGIEVDHKDGDTLNNTRDNLRAVTRQENKRNRAGASRNSKSGVLGVRKFQRSELWEAHIQIRGERRSLGCFKTKDEAISARLRAERDLWGVQPRRAEAHGKIDGFEPLSVVLPRTLDLIEEAAQ